MKTRSFPLAWLPAACLLALMASFGLSAVAGWLLLRHGGYHGPDPLITPGMRFYPYLASRFFVWDGQWYDVIARVGYVWHPSTTDRQSLAFFPLWGLLLRPLYRILPAHQHLAALLLTLAVAYAAIDQFFRLGRRLVGDRAAVIATVLYAAWPAGHFLLQSYPTALMNLLALLVLRDGIEGREWRPALLAGLGTAAGPLMVVTGFWIWLLAAYRRRDRLFAPRSLLTLLALGLLALWGILAFIGWQAVALHDPFAFLMAQKPWDLPRPPLARLWRGVWMSLVLQDLYHIGRLLAEMVRFWRHGDLFWAFVRYQFALNFAGLTLLMASLFWCIAIRPRSLLLYGGLALLFYIIFHGTTHSGLSTMRLIYIAAPSFWGLGRALQRETMWAWGVALVFSLALIGQEILLDIGQLVL